ncbi:L-serine ammonia-lyase [Natronospira bacteriovora]|uniref:L-serine dehydratase n=1 Tax=Natronospira bacteriovora TaxID=3069753 RepID=A0ABU0W4C0_9GAMM|nr:L-serine ammonia-lyase [Natronospira sp. AB-CW4]MDQ2068874.1 L-serine ammonia-lyase [Natronospira sp. AB-CW4]
MAVSVFDMFKIGIGPSSSHTVGPMRAALAFCEDMVEKGVLEDASDVVVKLYGSLALTGVGHGTDKAVILGLLGETPREVNPDAIEGMLDQVKGDRRIALMGRHEIDFDPAVKIEFHNDERLPRHSNGMGMVAFDANGQLLHEEIFYSIGGGFIVREHEDDGDGDADESSRIPHPFSTAEDLLGECRRHKVSIWQLMLENEKTWREEATVCEELLAIWQVMQECTQRGFRVEGNLPGGLEVRRRAPRLYRELQEQNADEHLDLLDWVNVFALAVNEENAAGGQVVTAPTNGAAGIIPAVLHYYNRFVDDASEEGVIRFLLTAGAIGILYKKNAGISGAEMGCQGEVGVACSMAAAGLTEAIGGSLEQVENAAEIGMEHNLGLTCDPVGGLVQIPCIERNAMGALKAINASRMAMRGDGQHKVSLDQVIRTMRQTGEDMKSIYKETSLGGLAVNVPEC